MNMANAHGQDMNIDYLFLDWRRQRTTSFSKGFAEELAKVSAEGSES
jgi:hypothetical protein